ncbi:MAG TPA: T9SS type A sorting domain-containing protein, partial [Saprospiraceae bacterium]|nr:T9SS type A sorting domain-containing protein [Saprospiraceae bacterium]
KNEIWLFKINADGCYGTDDCPEEIILSAEDELKINEEIRIYPNPAQDILYIATHDNVKLLNVTLIAIDGKVISEAKNIGNTKHSMDVSAIDSGIYFVNVSTENGKVFTRKVIVD